MDYEIIITSLISGIILGIFLLYWINKFAQKFILWRRFRKARQAEKNAEKLLKKHGYKILEKESRAPLRVKVDADRFETFVRADFLVSKDNLFYVAEVKSGQSAPSILDSATRRQLLEYNFVFKPDGILLVDMEKRKIHSIEFKED